MGDSPEMKAVLVAVVAVLVLSSAAPVPEDEIVPEVELLSPKPDTTGPPSGTDRSLVRDVEHREETRKFKDQEKEHEHEHEHKHNEHKEEKKPKKKEEKVKLPKCHMKCIGKD